jgi:hypothetical protein
MMRRPCLGWDGRPCAQLVRPPALRCAPHQALRDRQVDASRGTTAERGYGSEWQREARATLRAWVAEHGHVCPGWGRRPHESADLVVDHQVGPLCRSCNSRKAATFDKAQPRDRGPR